MLWSNGYTCTDDLDLINLQVLLERTNKSTIKVGYIFNTHLQAYQGKGDIYIYIASLIHSYWNLWHFAKIHLILEINDYICNLEKNLFALLWVYINVQILNVFILDMNLFHLLDRIFDIFKNSKHKFSVYYIFLEFRTFFSRILVTVTIMSQLFDIFTQDITVFQKI